jgi:hypothetical protein
MSWRYTQLGDQMCDQDQLILELFNGVNVNYVGPDFEFRSQLKHDPGSARLILILNRPMWTSEIISACRTHLTNNIELFYIGVNRYQVLGNDTNTFIKNTKNTGGDLIEYITNIIKKQGFVVSKTGQFDNDQGRYFNFVQPLTWIYGYKTN